ncbi:hypothetical protein A2966_03895 [Candidatus Roizmanbacteria bacterium RIFCSPLOWO2_01_FULL_41_22]|uniref:Carbohydrate kinase PfkB domain-containing protein n=2 Tax=Candidatus Roizmaniibacteriota TaxID=1752723 RepID=A0A1F7JQ94_9BACT|nr:MAG: hypothetical protein A2966_03895 [Candidatus Roizmanbacteria bacterium RIFCSPLOWO2_01_FULL_41_22]OGK57785.1 MAG: hypothetical protein A3H86_02080 [Candidatus Roizmanbacteria bacterium RIFCSPLOWO2_02_FULL_41_9]
MYDLISIGAVGIDLYFQGERLTHSKDRFELAIGGKYFAERFYEGLGGGGANVAIGVSRHNLQVALFSEIGQNAFKKIILDKLVSERINYSQFCQFEKDYLNISCILLKEDGEKTIVNYRSQHQKLLETKSDLTDLKKGKAVYLANMPNISLHERYRILTWSKHHKILTFVNLGVVDCRRPKQELREFLKKIDILIINAHEFADLVKAPFGDIDWKENVSKYYLPHFNGQLLIVTNGEKGSYAYINKHIFHQPAEKLRKILDTTGAGDGYTAGFIAEYLQSADIQRAMSSGTKYAARILDKIGAN